MPGLGERRRGALQTQETSTFDSRVATTILILAVVVLAACGPATTPTPSPSATPRAGDVAWTILGRGGFPAQSMMPLDIAASGGTVVVVGLAPEDSTPSNTASSLPIWSSVDGGAWTAATLEGTASGSPQSIAVSEDGFVAVGADGCTPRFYQLTMQDCQPAIWHSTDSLTWTRVAFDAPANAQLTSVTAWKDGLLAVGGQLVTAGSTRKERPVLFRSTDGTTWERLSPSNALDGALTDVATDGETLIATGRRGGAGEMAMAAAWSSMDGVAWTAESLPGAAKMSQWVSVSAMPGGFGALDVRASSGATFARSVWRRDTSWHALNAGTDLSEPHLMGIASGPFGGIVVGLDESYRPVLYASQDGASWGPVSPVGELPKERFGLIAATWAEGRFLVSAIDLGTYQPVVLAGMAYVPRPGEIAYVTPEPTPSPTPGPTPSPPPVYAMGSATVSLSIIDGYTATKDGATQCTSRPGGQVPQLVELYEAGTAAGLPVGGTLDFTGAPAKGSAAAVHLTVLRMDNAGASDTSWDLKGELSTIAADGMAGTVTLAGTAGTIAWACGDWVSPNTMRDRTAGYLGELRLDGLTADWTPATEPAQCQPELSGGVARVSGVIGSYKGSVIRLDLPLRGNARPGQRLAATLDGPTMSEHQVRALVTLTRLAPNEVSGTATLSLRFAVPMEGWPDRLDGTLTWRCPGRTDTDEKPMAACPVAGTAPTGANLAAGRDSTVSAELPSEPRSAAFDGEANRAWNSGDYAIQWIEVDLGKPVQVGEVRLQVAQTPAGHTEHHLYGRTGPDAPLVALAACGGETNDLQTLVLSVGSGAKPMRYLRIETVASPSWIAWREIEVYAGT